MESTIEATRAGIFVRRTSGDDRAVTNAPPVVLVPHGVVRRTDISDATGRIQLQESLTKTIRALTSPKGIRGAAVANSEQVFVIVLQARQVSRGKRRIRVTSVATVSSVVVQSNAIAHRLDDIGGSP